MIQGFTGQLDMWANRSFFEPTVIERIDGLLASEECPDAIVVLVDCWTSYGGSQFLDSTGTGRYQSYLCDEVVPFVDERYPTAADRDHRGITGKSSGGYGAMVVPMMRPDVFGALASHAGDALFESDHDAGHRARLPHAAPALRVLLRPLLRAAPRHRSRSSSTRTRRPWRSTPTRLRTRPTPSAPARRWSPFDLESGRLVPEVWERWLDHDPVRMAAGHAEALRSMRRIYLDAGESDEYFLDVGAQAFSAELNELGVEHTLELFDGKHGGISHRYPGAIRELIVALSD